MKHFAFVIVIITFSTIVLGQSKPPKPKVTPAISPAAQACKDRLKELSDLNDHMDSLTLDKLTSIQKELSDCVYAESAGLSKDDAIVAYKLRDSTGKEASKRIRDAAKVISDDDKRVREIGLKMGQGFLDEEKSYKDLIQRYNTLVDAYNGMLRDYRATVEQNGRFLDRMQDSIRAANYESRMNAIQTIIDSATSAQPQLVYKPPTQLRCTTQTMPTVLPGQPSWTYTNCY